MSENRPVPARLESFTHAPMCNWLSVGQLVQTGIRAAVASTVGGFADGREMAAALHPPQDNPPIDLSGAATDVFWVDYLADTGDGWNPTYSMAYTLAQKDLSVVGVPQPLSRGNLLVLGGIRSIRLPPTVTIASASSTRSGPLCLRRFLR